MNVARRGDICTICGALVVRVDGPSVVCLRGHRLVNPDHPDGKGRETRMSPERKAAVGAGG